MRPQKTEDTNSKRYVHPYVRGEREGRGTPRLHLADEETPGGVGGGREGPPAGGRRGGRGKGGWEGGQSCRTGAITRRGGFRPGTPCATSRVRPCVTLAAAPFSFFPSVKGRTHLVPAPRGEEVLESLWGGREGPRQLPTVVAAADPGTRRVRAARVHLEAFLLLFFSINTGNVFSSLHFLSLADFTVRTRHRTHGAVFADASRAWEGPGLAAGC